MIEKWKKTELSNKEIKALKKIAPFQTKRLNKDLIRLNKFKMHFNDKDSIFFTIQKKDFEYSTFINEFGKYLLFFNKKYNGFYKIRKAYSRFNKTVLSYVEAFAYLDFYKSIAEYLLENELEQIDNKREYLINKANVHLFAKFNEILTILNSIFKNDEYYKIISSKVSYDNEKLFDCNEFIVKIESYGYQFLKMKKITEDENWSMMRSIFELTNYIYTFEHLYKQVVIDTF